MATTIVNPLLAPLLHHCLVQRREWIVSQLSPMGIPSHELPFTTFLAKGSNLFVPPCNPKGSHLLLVAHYDGETAQDNAGGVWLTLELLKQFWHSSPNRLSLAALFTDKEETFQQGACSFIKQCLRLPTPALNPEKVLCIDGFGTGTRVITRQHTSPFTYLGHYFRLDADVFREAGFNVWTLFSGLECIKPAQKGSTSIDEIGDLSFPDQRLYDLKEEAIAQFLQIYQASD